MAAWVSIPATQKMLREKNISLKLRMGLHSQLNVSLGNLVKPNLNIHMYHTFLHTYILVVAHLLMIHEVVVLITSTSGSNNRQIVELRNSGLRSHADPS